MNEWARLALFLALLWLSYVFHGAGHGIVGAMVLAAGVAIAIKPPEPKPPSISPTGCYVCDNAQPGEWVEHICPSGKSR